MLNEKRAGDCESDLAGSAMDLLTWYDEGAKGTLIFCAYVYIESSTIYIMYVSLGQGLKLQFFQNSSETEEFPKFPQSIFFLNPIPFTFIFTHQRVFFHDFL